MYLPKQDLIKSTSRRGPVAMEFEVLTFALAKLTGHYQIPQNWNIPPAIPFTWYWEILAKTCQLVTPSVGSMDLRWCHEGRAAVTLLAQVYSAFCKAFSVNRSLQQVPDAVERCKDVYMRRYFQWVQQLQNFISAWRQKIIEEDWTEDEILHYANMAVCVQDIAMALHVEALQVRMEDVTDMKTNMQKLKPFVKETLIRIGSDGRR